MKKTFTRFPWMLMTLMAMSQAFGEIAVRFDSDRYETTETGDFTVKIVVDGDSETSDFDPVAMGLFSYGVKVEFPAAAVDASGTPVEPAAALNYNGFVPGAAVRLTDASIFVTGNIQLASATIVPYTGVSLFSVTLQNRAPAGSRYKLVLDSARTNPTQVLFVDGVGNPLDESIEYQSVEVTVTEDPDVTPPRLAIRPVPPGSVEISYDLLNQRDHFVQVTEDLITWTDLFSVPRNEGSVVVPASGARRFFRLRTVPVEASR